MSSSDDPSNTYHNRVPYDEVANENGYRTMERIPISATSIHDLDSFMKSFEEDITTSPTSSHGSGAAEERIVESASDCGESGEVEEGIVELVSDSGESRPEI
ncbi:hypothetical protein SASPL_130700 [Salvia splendens]|uniref:Uncharacterized protein n=1 Tax=Salvia splendens TaxID=180675 RepID=A0A8X8X8P1_SALSN|nr:hypothetical protein SASPL_130700 [Salvia splendens]